MPTGICVSDFVRKGDFDVRLTLFNYDPKMCTFKDYKSAWIQTICSTVSSAFVTSHSTFIFDIYDCVSNKAPIRVTCKGTDFAAELDKLFEKPISLRIELAGSSRMVVFVKKSWIIFIS